MSQYLHGIHDPGGEPLMADKPGWIVHTEALTTNGPMDYRQWANAGFTNIVRLNWGYGSTGTLPRPERYAEFAQACAAFVAKSPGCTRWIIGNEPNHRQEWPDGVTITPQQYAACFRQCRSAIRQVQPQAEVLVAAVAPWNVEAGDWLDYYSQMLVSLLGECDGLTLHTYTHGHDPALVTSEQKMDAPYQDRHFHFRAYQDLLGVVPAGMRRLPVYITEFDGNEVWPDADTGLVEAAFAEIDAWNKRPGTQKIQALCLYRWPDYDRWGIAHKPGVQQALRKVVAQGYPSPGAETVVPVPVSQPGEATVVRNVTTPPIEWDPRLNARGVKIVPVTVQPGQTYYKVVKATWLNEQESQGRHHIYVEVLDEQGKRMVGVPVTYKWPSGAWTGPTEDKRGEAYSGNYAMSKSLNEFSVCVADGASETVTGIGMGADGNSGIHTSTCVVFQRTVAPAVQPAPSAPTTQVYIPVAANHAVPPTTMPHLVHPIEETRLRVVSQPFGVNAQNYQQFAVDGVALRGHNGIDFAVPSGTPVRAVADGVAVEVTEEVGGYGLYVKLEHGWGQSLYAHLSRQDVPVGSRVAAGQPVGLSGATGNASGPHLHFGLRIAPFNRQDGWGGYTDPAPYLSDGVSVYSPVGSLVRASAQASGVDTALLASLVWAESSFQPNAHSPAGAQGLGQLMPATWAEWAGKVGASDPLNPADNLRVAASYLKWLLGYFQGDRYKAVAAYNAGPGNVQAGRIPPETQVYAAKVLHGADLLHAMGLD